MTLNVSPLSTDGDALPHSISLKMIKQPFWRSFFLSSWFLGGLLWLLAIGFNLYRLGVPSVWFDEAFSVELVSQPFDRFWHIISGPEANMELYYFLLFLWLKLISIFHLAPTEFIVRIPSALAAAFASLSIFLLGRRFINTIGGLLVSFIFMTNFQQLIYAQQTRAYSFQLLFLILSWYFLLNALSRGGRKYWLVYTLCSVCAVYSHLFSVLVLISQGIAFLGFFFFPTAWRAMTRKQWLPYVLSVLTSIVLVSPMIWLTLHSGAKTGWLPQPTLQDIKRILVPIAGDIKLYLLLLEYGIAAAVILVTLGLLIRIWRKPAPIVQPIVEGLHSSSTNLFPILWASLCWAVLPTILSYILSQGSMRLYSTRYLIAIVPPVLILVALGFTILISAADWVLKAIKGAVPFRFLQTTPLIRFVTLLVQLGMIIIFVFIASRSLFPYYNNADVEPWNQMGHWISDHYQEGDGIVCFDNSFQADGQQGCQISLEYYLHAYPGPAHFDTDMPGYFSWELFSTPQARDAIDAQKVLTYAQNHKNLFYVVGRTRSAEDANLAFRMLDTLQQKYILKASYVANGLYLFYYQPK